METVTEVEKDFGPPIQTVPTSEPVNMFDLNSNSEEADQVTEMNLQPSTENDSAELLRIHHKFGHVPFQRLQAMAKQGTIPARLGKCPVPVCASCFYGKATKRAKGSKTPVSILPLKKITRPGEVVSVDCLTSATPGLIAQTAGGLTHQRYLHAIVFVDHYSDLSYLHLLKTQSGDEVLEAKEAFETYAGSFGIDVRHYHADNGIFNARAWRTSCSESHQGLSFAGVNAHHQNGRAERRVRSLQDMARTMLVHANHRWPEAITANLWPYAIRAANDSLNATPCARHKFKSTPLQIFSRADVDVNPKHWIPFGSPVYVLENKLQAAHPIYEKWKSRARLGIYLGRSPMHARSVALVLSLSTGFVSPQYHVVFYPSFRTVHPSQSNQVPKCVWQTKCGFDKQGPREVLQGNQIEEEPQFISPTDISIIPEPEGGPIDAGADIAIQVNDEANVEQTTENEQPEAIPTAPPESLGQLPTVPTTTTTTTATTGTRRLTRANRGRRTEPTFQSLQEREILRNEVVVDDSRVPAELFSFAAMHQHRELATEELQAMSTTGDPDVLQYHQAMRQPDAREFANSVKEEFASMLNNQILSFIELARVPPGTTIFPAVWAMKRKRRVKTREVYKWKARLAFDGSRQVAGVHYDQTYAPVASWETIRLLLTMVLKNNWKTRQLDYVLAFPQAPAERELYMKIPKGIQVDSSTEYVLKVERNLYGQKQAGRVWNQHLVRRLVERVGFRQSVFDDCVFYKGSTIYVLYTDDSILMGPNDQELDDIIRQIADAGLDITEEEGGLEDFLGVNIERTSEGGFHLSQPQLIEQILTDLNLLGENVKIRDTPALSTAVLSEFPDSVDHDQHFHYRSVIGKLNYLEKSTRPDIAYAVHQCARFSKNPKVEHAKAVKLIGRYLRGTRNKGIYLRPTDDSFVVWADADFSGNWKPDDNETTNNADTARSRSGYIVSYLGCPVLWKSQLQTEIALSSTESEYISLSQSLRKAIPLMELVKEMKVLGYNVGQTVPAVHCTLFEDNAGALCLAKAPAMRPRTKHINVKYHHFRAAVAAGEVTVQYVSTDDQVADMLTKANPVSVFEKHRQRLMGW